MVQFINIKSHQNKYLSFIFIMIFNIINLQNLFATEKIGNVVKIQNNAYVLSADGDKILLNLYDSIYLNDKIITDDRSSLVIQYLDNTTIIMKKSTSIKVTDFSLTAAKIQYHFGKFHGIHFLEISSPDTTIK